MVQLITVSSTFPKDSDTDVTLHEILLSQTSTRTSYDPISLSLSLSQKDRCTHLYTDRYIKKMFDRSGSNPPFSENNFNIVNSIDYVF